jgi:hypothetical protein
MLFLNSHVVERGIPARDSHKNFDELLTINQVYPCETVDQFERPGTKLNVFYLTTALYFSLSPIFQGAILCSNEVALILHNPYTHHRPHNTAQVNYIQSQRDQVQTSTPYLR